MKYFKIILHLAGFFTTPLTNYTSLKSERQQVFSSFLKYSEYSNRSSIAPVRWVTNFPLRSNSFTLSPNLCGPFFVHQLQ